MDYKEVVARIDLRQIITTGRRISGNKPVMIRCFWHDDHAPSLAIYSNRVHCFGCGKSLSTLEWIAENEGYDLDISFKEVVNIANDKYVGLVSVTLPPQRKPKEVSRLIPVGPMNIDFAFYCHENLGNKRQWYLNRRLTNLIIDNELLGYYNNAFAIPVWDGANNLIAMRYRRDDDATKEGNKYWGTIGRNQTFIYNMVALSMKYLDKHFGTIVITEGELDCLRLWCEGVPAIAFTNGAGSAYGFLMSKTGLSPFDLAQQVIIAFDMDGAGILAAERILTLFRGKARRFTWDPIMGNDITELVNNIGIGATKELMEVK